MTDGSGILKPDRQFDHGFVDVSLLIITYSGSHQL